MFYFVARRAGRVKHFKTQTVLTSLLLWYDFCVNGSLLHPTKRAIWRINRTLRCSTYEKYGQQVYLV